MKDESLISGVAASPGTGYAPILLVTDTDPAVSGRSPGTPEEELARFSAACAAVQKQIAELKSSLEGRRDEWTLKLFDTHIYLASDPELSERTGERIVRQNSSAEQALVESAAELAEMLESSGSEVMAERASDLRDVVKRILEELGGGGRKAIMPEGDVIIAADELSPIETSGLDPSLVRGIVTGRGGFSCHTAIMARSLGIPAVTGVGDALARLEDGMYAVVDGSEGSVRINPDRQTVLSALSAIGREAAEKDDLSAWAARKTVSRDGVRITLGAQLGGMNGLDSALASNADEIGLFRTEFLFMGRNDFPDEQDQYETYSRILSRMSPRRVVIRTIDIGGDKNLPYSGIAAEDNPFLGLRGIRYSLKYPEVFRVQLRALLRASVSGNLSVMFPMAATVDEIAEARRIMDQEKASLLEEGVPVAGDIETGMMMEIPSAALAAEDFAPFVDFFSIGTNDLVQYTMAADRGNREVAHLYQPLHPSVLKLIEMIVRAAAGSGIRVGVCGEAASDPEVVPELLRLGIRELSVGADAVLRIRRLIAGTDAGPE